MNNVFETLKQLDAIAVAVFAFLAGLAVAALGLEEVEVVVDGETLGTTHNADEAINAAKAALAQGAESAVVDFGDNAMHMTNRKA